MGSAYLWPQLFGHKLSLPEFLWAYRPFALVREVGFFSLSSRSGRKLIDKCPSNNKGWKIRFFQVPLLRLCEDGPQSGTGVPVAWPSGLSGKVPHLRAS